MVMMIARMPFLKQRVIFSRRQASVCIHQIYPHARIFFPQEGQDKMLKTHKIMENVFISPTLKRDLIEEKHRSEFFAERIVEGLPDPDNRFYDVMMRSILEDLKKFT